MRSISSRLLRDVYFLVPHISTRFEGNGANTHLGVQEINDGNETKVQSEEDRVRIYVVPGLSQSRFGGGRKEEVTVSDSIECDWSLRSLVSWMRVEE